MANYAYIRSKPGLWTVGFYRSDGKWEPESDHDSPEKAAARARFMNGGKSVSSLGSELAALVLAHDNGDWTPTVAEWHVIVAKAREFQAKEGK